jgi:RNA polymerase sigma factor (sigma-70 family)
MSPPSATHLSLLWRVRDTSDCDAWAEFAERYRDSLLRFCRGQGLQQADAEDVVQVVLAGLARSMPSFAYSPERGRFRDYLYRCTRNAIALLSSRARLAQRLPAEDPADERPGADSRQAWEQEWIAHHYRLAMQQVRDTFDPRSVEIFDLSLAGCPVGDLAERFGTTTQAVHKVRQRIRARLEQLIARQLQEEEQPHDR